MPLTSSFFWVFFIYNKIWVLHVPPFSCRFPLISSIYRIYLTSGFLSAKICLVFDVWVFVFQVAKRSHAGTRVAGLAPTTDDGSGAGYGGGEVGGEEEEEEEEDGEVFDEETESEYSEDEEEEEKEKEEMERKKQGAKASLEIEEDAPLLQRGAGGKEDEEDGGEDGEDGEVEEGGDGKGK